MGSMNLEQMVASAVAAALAGNAVQAAGNGASKAKGGKGKVNIAKVRRAGKVSDLSGSVSKDGSLTIILDEPNADGKPTKSGRILFAGAGFQGIKLGSVLGRTGVRAFVTLTCDGDE